MQIEIVSIVPSLIVLAAAALVAELVARSSGAWRTLLAEGASQKYVTIEGLRGCLALAVFLSHGVALHFWYQTGERLWPPSVFYRLCGSVSVYMFFMVTGLLFWGKAIAGGGHIDIRRLYASRLRRLAPMYLFCLVPIFTIVGYRTGWTLRVPPLELAASIGAWLGLGMLAFPDINGVADTLSIDGALWTLCYEWLFYLALPLLAVFATRSRFVGVAAIGVAAPLLVGQRGYLAASILVGMAIAQFGEGLRAPAWLRSRPVALGAALPLIASLGLSDGVSGLWPFVGAVPLFVAIAAGNDLWGVLSSRAVRFLGMISYSVYVTHSIVLQIVMGGVNLFFPVVAIAPLPYWCLMTVIAAIVVLICAVTYRWIERPAMRGRAMIASPHWQPEPAVSPSRSGQ